MKALNKRVSEEIRNIVLEAVREHPEHAFHVTSNLNWHRYEKQIEQVATTLPHGRILDVGCGLGHTASMLAACRPDLQIVGVDVADWQSWVKLAKYGPRFLICDALALPFRNEFDAVISFGVMEHTGDEDRFLRQVNSVLRAGGNMIIFNLPNRYALSEAAARVMNIWHHDRTYTRERIVGLVQGAGFSVVNMKRESLVPAQVDRISESLSSLFNRYYLQLDRMDSWLTRPPLSIFAENWTIYAGKP